jgi:hypothetical protein
MVVYYEIHYNDDICSLLSVIALGKLGLGEGSASPFYFLHVLVRYVESPK